MQSETLSLQHKEMLSQRFSSLSLDISEYTFANLYLFRKIHRYEVLFAFDIFVKGVTRDGVTYLMPTSPMEKIDQKQLADLLAGGNLLYPIPEEWAGYFDPNHFRTEINENDSDYLYMTAKMRTYAGRHLAGRRNLVKQFKEHYVVQSFPLAKERLGDAQAILDQWLVNSKQEEETDYGPCLEALQLFDVLALSGRIYYVDEKPVGFLIGEPLNERVYVIHFAKTNVLYKGIYQYMYQSFAQDLDEHFLAINLEQDMGERGLQQAKRAYFPEKLFFEAALKFYLSDNPIYDTLIVFCTEEFHRRMSCPKSVK